MDPRTDEPEIAAWDRRVDWWLTGLAVMFLAAYAWQVLDPALAEPGATAPTRRSPRSATRCGGRSPRSPPSVTATASR